MIDVDPYNRHAASDKLLRKMSDAEVAIWIAERDKALAKLHADRAYFRVEPYDLDFACMWADDVVASIQARTEPEP